MVVLTERENRLSVPEPVPPIGTVFASLDGRCRTVFEPCPHRGTRPVRVRRPRYAPAVAAVRVLPRLVRHVWRTRNRLERQREGLVSEIATALDSLLSAHAVGRGALAAYRLAMRTLLVAAILFLVAGAALAVGLRDSTVAVVIGILLAVGGGVLGWQWWTWSIGLRFLRRNVDPARRVPPGELPGRLTRLAAEARPTSETVARELDELGRALRKQ